MIVVYKITSPTGKIYIGQSWSYKKRLKDYFGLTKGSIGPVLYKSFIKYGVANHEFEIVCEFPKDITQHVLNQYEIYFISAYKNCGSKMLNVTDGGSGIFGYRHTNNTKLKMRLNNAGENNPNFGKGLLGEKNGNFGKGLVGSKNGMFNRKHSNESINKMRLNRGKISVLKINKNLSIEKEYATMAEAAREEGLFIANISAVCRGKKRTAGGFIWKYKKAS